MKRNIRIFAVLLVICMFMTSINVYALDANKVVEEEHTFTKAELACMTDGSLGTATSLSEEFIEIKNIEGKTTRASTTYYIIEMADGYMLTSPSSGAFSRTRYANSGSNNVRKWIFTKDSDGDYIVYSYTDSTKCLTIDPSTKAVTLSTYTGSEFQQWRMYYSSIGNTLRSTATDSRVNGYKLVIGSTSCSVSNTTYTPVGFFDVDWYTPVSTLSHPNFHLALEQNTTVTPNKYPSDASCSNNWINWSSSNSSRFTVNDNGKVTGVSAGTATLTFRDKITRKYGTCTITVMPIANGTYFLQNKENSDYAKVKDGTMTNGQNVVQYDFGEGNEFRWIFTLDTTTGYFSIKSAHSGSVNYYMAVSDDSSALDKPIVIRSATETTLTEGMKWKVETTANGAYKIIPKTGEATNYVLATSVSTGTNNKNLLQGDYIDNNSYRDEWFFERRSETTIEGQRWEFWCWATSARMLANHYSSVADDRTQNNAVSAVKGSVVNAGGSHIDAIGAVGYYRSNDISTNTLNLVGDFGSRFSESTLIRLLNAGHVVYIGRGHYDTSNNRAGGHALLIVGYTMVSLDDTLQYRYIIYDPWPASPPSPWNSPQITTGQEMVRSYQWICNGRNALNSSHVDDGIWDRYVVVQTDYSNVTLTPVYN